MSAKCACTAMVFGYALMAVAMMNSCATVKQPRHVVVQVDSALYEAINDIHATEQQMLCGAPSCAGRPDSPVAGWDRHKSEAFNTKLLPVAEAGRQLNTRLAAWQPGQPVPSEVQQLVQGLGDSLSTVTADFPAGATKEKILQDIAIAEKVALSVLSSVMAFQK